MSISNWGSCSNWGTKGIAFIIQFSWSCRRSHSRPNGVWIQLLQLQENCMMKAMPLVPHLVADFKEVTLLIFWRFLFFLLFINYLKMKRYQILILFKNILTDYYYA